MINEKVKVGIIGFGAVGQYLFKKLTTEYPYNREYEIAFVWNRSKEKFAESGIKGIEQYILGDDLVDSFFNNAKRQINYVDVVVEVAHPEICKNIGTMILEFANFMPTSLTAFADNDFKTAMYQKAITTIENSLYIPSGAAWGINDIEKMANNNALTDLEITMKFGVDALKLNEPLKQKLEAYKKSDKTDEQLLFSGSVKEIASLAPNNVNTMCCYALAANNLNFDKVIGNLYAHKNKEEHIVITKITGNSGFKVISERINPAKKGAVTGNATFQSFLNSLLKVEYKEPGIYFV